MKKMLLIIFIFFTTISNAQQFITSGTIQFEVKTNVHKSFEDEDEATWLEMIKENVPKFTTNYYTYTFANNESIYKFEKSGDKSTALGLWGSRDDESIWYNNFNTNSFVNLKIIDGYLKLSGEHQKINWKIFPNDQRVIAGFNCRKAQAVLFDSVYVFAYYTDEINISGGPLGLHGLPGMILGVTVPRMYTSWVATSVSLHIADKSIIKAPTKGKAKTAKEIFDIFEKQIKAADKYEKKWKQRQLWEALL